MKFILASLTLMCGLVLARLEEEAICRCSLMVSSEHSENMVYELEPITITDCLSHGECKNACVEEMDLATSQMDLWAEFRDTGVTVGQTFCTELESHFIYFVHNAYVHGYYEVCGGPWEYTGLDSVTPLCCELGVQKHCIA